MYQGIQVGFERADIVTYTTNGEGDTILELKSQTNSISKKEFIQLYKYLQNLNIKAGYIINFIITHESILEKNESSKYKYLELYKVELTDFKLFKYSFKTSEYKNFSL